MKHILVFNIGSSTIKYELFEYRTMKSAASGFVDGISKGHEKAIEGIFRNKLADTNIVAIGHRVVHGGDKFWQPTKITPKVTSEIKKLSPLAPLHNPANLAGIMACKKIMPNVAQYAIFDTAFHRTLPEIARRYAIPKKLVEKYDIHRYGFHGISHEYVFKEARALLGAGKTKRTVTCHLGNGCSVTAIKDGRSIETSMGFTPLEGLTMGTRSGDIDPGVLIFLQLKGFSAEKIDTLLNKESGLEALSGTTWDVRLLWKKAKKGNKKALFALHYFSYKIAKYIAAYTAVLGGLDTLVFTAGIGQNAWYVREWVCEYLKHLGVRLAKKANKDDGPKISSSTSKVHVLALPTDEERHIALAIKLGMSS
jgi:acetate kinase